MLVVGPWGGVAGADGDPSLDESVVLQYDGDPGLPADPIPTEGTSIYTVLAGDWLSTIAPRIGYGSDWQRLWQENRAVIGENPHLIFPGQELVVRITAPLPPVPPVAPADGGSVGNARTVHPLYDGAPITSDYGPRGGEFHDGLDFDCAIGDVVRAASDGTVTVSGVVNGYGNYVRIVHEDGTSTFYAHLDTRSVEEGQTISVGLPVGTCGNTGQVQAGPNGDGSHLHWGASSDPDGDLSINPRTWAEQHGLAL